jgi:HEAT repeat protein
MMDTTFQARVESLLLAAFVIMATLWLVMSAYVVVNRLLHDRRARHLTRAGGAPGERVDVERLARDAMAYGGRHTWSRIGALFALAQADAAEARDALEVAIADEDVDVALAAATILHRLGDERAAAVLVGALRAGPVPASRIAVHLEQLPIAVPQLLVPLLADADPGVRYWGASLLLRHGAAARDPRAIAAALAPLADDPHAAVRKAALVTLAALDIETAAAAAQPNVQHEVAFVRSAAIRVLAHAGATLPDLTQREAIARAIAHALGDGHWEVRSAAKAGLVRLGPITWRAAAAQLESADDFARDGAAEVLREMGVTDWAERHPGAAIVHTVPSLELEGAAT